MKFFIILSVVFAIINSAATLTPNEKLKGCCAQLKDADKECVEKFCDFSAISQANILNYLSTCTERGPTVGQMWDCASTRIDHTKCCEKKGVSGKCLEYCSAHDGVPPNYLDYLFCVESFNEIRECFVEHLEKNEPWSPIPKKKGKN
uniref:DB domain-containing protein n=1 Tax=Parastrongyloides trichosuri TaxID=131310 RepID=A0A0N4ZHJ8_PARTI